MTEPIRGQALAGAFDDATKGIIPSEEVTRVHLLRHGEVERLTSRMVRGHLEVPLSARGAEEHERLAGWLARAEPRPDRILSSDLSRCRLLAERLSREAGVPVECDKRLREQFMGAWEGKTWEELTRLDPQGVTAYWDNYRTARPSGGESMGDLYDRVAAWWRETAPEIAGRRVFIVTHIGVIRSFMCLFLGLPPSEALRFAPATASHTSVLLAEAGAVVNAFGERPWISGPEEAS